MPISTVFGARSSSSSLKLSASERAITEAFTISAPIPRIARTRSIEISGHPLEIMGRQDDSFSPR